MDRLLVLTNFLGSSEALYFGHLNVHQHEVKTLFRHQLHCLVAVIGSNKGQPSFFKSRDATAWLTRLSSANKIWTFLFPDIASSAGALTDLGPINFGLNSVSTAFPMLMITVPA